MKKRLKACLLFFVEYRIHFVAWLFFIFYEVILSGMLRGYFASFGNYFVFYACNISLFYLHAHVVLPAARKKAKNTIWLLPLLIVIEVAVYVPLTIYIVAFLQQYANLSVFTEAEINKASIANGVLRTIYFILFSSGYYYLMNYIRERKHGQAVEKERLLMIIENQNVQAELIKSQHAYLKAQINPHFLFNTLSFIYANTRKVVPEAAESIMALSEMMRYALQDDGEQILTPLSLEIKQVENFIRLHQIKSENAFHISFEYEPDLEDVQIIPLVLMTLVENMFKHGDLLKEERPASISICSDGRTVIIETDNYINPIVASTSHHIGLENTRKRLHMVYGDKASLETERRANNYFSAVARIELK
uniref:sensor histidine kinase n=1 Tax=Pedobacter schmidteae TaxID=2201271 RepID=UPI000EB0F239|nr:histidine kinase [Pedobacter schmidteae]